MNAPAAHPITTQAAAVDLRNLAFRRLDAEGNELADNMDEGHAITHFPEIGLASQVQPQQSERDERQRMKIELIAVTLLVLALIGLAAYMLAATTLIGLAAYKLAVATNTGLTVFWGIILVVNIVNCWKLLKAYANLCA